VLWIVGLLALAAAMHWLGPQLKTYVTQFSQWIEGLGPWGPLAFILGYIVFTVALIPGSILTMAGGALFGLWFGTLYVTCAAVIGSTLAFLISRHLARSRFEERLADNAKFNAIDRAIGEQGGKIVFLLRLSPVFPFTYLNYALGLSRVRLRDYVLAAVGMVPGTFLYVYYGKAIGDVAAIAAGTAPEKGAEQWVMLGVGLLATFAVSAYITRLARKSLSEAADV
jgi:uncharacterized membrane protein YdjX (TVP38/TMEM64 family)